MAKIPKSFRTAFQLYERGEKLGEGGCGSIFRAESAAGESVALKILDPQKATLEKRRRFKNEVAFCQQSHHDNIIRIIDYGDVAIGGDHAPFYVMPVYPKTLRDLLVAGSAAGRAECIISQLLDGVEAAHLKRVWHRDLKPENILLGDDDGLVIADFGIAHFAEEDLHTAVETRDHSRLANFQYAAPEQRQRGQSVDRRADIFSLGLMINEIFTGHVIQGTGVKAIAEETPEYGYLDHIVNKAVRQQPSDRYQSIDEIKTDLISAEAEWAARQRLDELSRQVIGRHEVTDSVKDDPIRLVAVSDYDGSTIHLRLNRVPPAGWVQDFRNLRHYRVAIMGKEPASFTFRDDTAYNDVTEQQTQMLVNHFKNYLNLANEQYLKRLETEARGRQEAEQEQLRRAKEEEARRQRVLGNIRV